MKDFLISVEEMLSQGLDVDEIAMRLKVTTDFARTAIEMIEQDFL